MSRARDKAYFDFQMQEIQNRTKREFALQVIKALGLEGVYTDKFKENEFEVSYDNGPWKPEMLRLLEFDAADTFIKDVEQAAKAVNASSAIERLQTALGETKK